MPAILCVSSSNAVSRKWVGTPLAKRQRWLCISNFWGENFSVLVCSLCDDLAPHEINVIVLMYILIVFCAQWVVQDLWGFKCCSAWSLHLIASGHIQKALAWHPRSSQVKDDKCVVSTEQPWAGEWSLVSSICLSSMSQRYLLYPWSLLAAILRKIFIHCSCLLRALNFFCWILPGLYIMPMQWLPPQQGMSGVNKGWVWS